MAFQLESTPGDGFLRIVLSGHGTGGEAAGIVLAVGDAVRAARASRVLIDVREVRGRLGIPDTYFLVRTYPTDLQAVPTAVIESEEHRKLADFHETAAVNVGRVLRFFFDDATAIAWLKAQR